MQDQPSQVLGEADPRVERAIILQFRRDDHEHRWSRAELEVAISNVAALDIDRISFALLSGGRRRRLQQLANDVIPAVRG